MSCFGQCFKKNDEYETLHSKIMSIIINIIVKLKISCKFSRTTTRLNI